MRLTRLAVDRPIATLMACLVVVILGGVSVTLLSVDLLPSVEFPTATVTTLYPGAGPEEIETLITRPLEQSLTAVPGFERVTSRSLEGSSNIRLEFSWGTDLDSAVSDMRQAIDRVQRDLPDDVDPPVIRRFDANDSPIIYLGVTSSLPPVELTRVVERSVIPRLERLPGAARVGLRGDVRREIHVDVDRAKVESMQLGLNEVVAALSRGNINRPAGDFEEGNSHRRLRSESEFKNLDEIRDLVIRQSGDAAVRVRDVARVEDSHERITQLTRINRKPGMMVYVFKQSGANVVDVSDRVRAAMEEINAEVPEVHLEVRMDSAEFIRQAIRNIRSSASEGMLLTMVVLIVFLGSIRSTLIIGITMPLSVMCTFALVYFQGYTLNMVSFGGLALGIGMLVDNSIVVLESIFRYRDLGETPRDAAIKGTDEVAMAIVASTMTSIIVFVPLLFIRGVTAILLHQLAFVVTASQISSLFVGLTLTPMLAAYLLEPKSRAGVAISMWARWSDRFGRMVGWCLSPLHGIVLAIEWVYAKLLRLALASPRVTLTLTLLLGSCALGLTPRIGTDFLPKTDDGRVGVTGEMPPGIRMEDLHRQAILLEDHLYELTPELVGVSMFIGDRAEEADSWHETRLIAQLKPRGERDVTAEAVRKRLADNMGDVAGMRVKARVYGAVPFFRSFGTEGENLTVLVRGHDRDVAENLAQVVKLTMQSIPGLVNVDLVQKEKQPELVTRIDRTLASNLDLNVADVFQTLETAVRGTRATMYREDGDEFPVIVRLQSEDRNRQSDLGGIGIKSARGGLVRLSSMVQFQPSDAPMAIERLDRQRAVLVSGSVEGRDLGAIVADLESALSRVPVPPLYQVEVKGDVEEQQKSFQAMTLGTLLAVILIYGAMAAQYESLLDPLVILGSLPFGAVGVILVLVYWNTTLNVQSFIGVIILAGIVVNNAIVLVDYFRQLQREQPDECVTSLLLQSATRRLRPVLMTMLTTVLGMIPMALGMGEGGELQAPLGRVVVGGMVSGTLITLIVIPVIYRLIITDSEPATLPQFPVASGPIPAA
ncbi:MAG: efflux RND transporter permease subunit [Planctomycetota bacterium]|nr:MAG: efflux RND transporter permease subunit [Planctomycetota bacterium]